MTMVRRTSLPNPHRRESNEPASNANIINRAAATPRTAKLAIISSVYCKKNTNANNINAGKATFPSPLLTLRAASGAKRLNMNPASMGTRKTTRFCTSSLPTGSSIFTPACSDTNDDTKPIITGMVKRVITLLSAVRVTESATLPFASNEKTFEELPPGQHATSTRPIK